MRDILDILKTVMNVNVTNSTVFVSLSNTASPIVILVWFEIIAACIT